MAERREEQLLFEARLLDAVGQSVIATDLEGKILYWNRAAEEIYGWSSEEALGRRLRDLTLSKELVDQAEEVVSELRAGRTWSGEALLRRKDGSYVPVLGTATPLFDDRGNIVGSIGVSTDISERKTLEEELERRASHDPLTGLPNRHTFVERIGHALQRTRRRQDSRNKVGVLFMDLDGFKTVNDSLGHEAGDELLVAVAERLKIRLRPEDVLARFGGDEFAVLLEDVADTSDVIRVAKRIVEDLREPLTVDHHQLTVSTSVGIALDTAHTNDPEGMLRDADAAMYRAKEQGPGRYAVFDPVMHARAQERLELEAELSQALEGGEFVLYYQPEVSLHDWSLVGFEALLRWQHPAKGLLQPSAFVPVAEETDLIVPIGRWVLEEACWQAKRWKAEHPSAPPATMEVNLSSRQLARQGLVKVIEEVLTRAELEGHCLGLDITETVLIEASEHNAQALDALKEMGIRLYLDDFGTGYSSLSYLKRFPVDRVKIDKSFVKGLGEEATDTALVRMIIDLCHTLGVEVLAEGVETIKQAALLKDMGCDLGQGNYFAEPLPGEVLSQQMSTVFLPYQPRLSFE